jgi:hypothetical protein
MATPKGPEPVTIEEALQLLQGHWSARLLRLVDRPADWLDRMGWSAGAEGWSRAMGPLWNWLCEEQARFLDRVLGRDKEIEPGVVLLFVFGFGLAGVLAAARFVQPIRVFFL